MDNLNTHVIASLYKKYPAQEARSYAKRLEIHYTPKHGSWLNIAEIELNVMTKQCLARRLDSISKVQQELAAWEKNEERGLWESNVAFYNSTGPYKTVFALSQI